MCRVVMCALLLCVSASTAKAQFTVTYATAVTVCGPQGCKTIYFPFTPQQPVYQPPEVFATPGYGTNGQHNAYYSPMPQYSPRRQTIDPIVQACGPNGCPPGYSVNGAVNNYYRR